MIVKFDTASVAAMTQDTAGLPPVHLWNPPFCGAIDMRIARDGTWHHEGRPITRDAMVRLFSSILKREEGRHMLVTPAEKVEIQVDDLPLHAVDVEEVAATGERPAHLVFTLRTGERVTLDRDHPLVVDTHPETREPAPRLHVRAGLWARIDRKTFMRLAEFGCQGLHDGASWFGLQSQGDFFPMIATSDLI